MRTVITYQSPRGNTVDLTREQVRKLQSRGVWPRDFDGQEFCSVSRGAHGGEPTFSCDTELLEGSR